MMAAEAEALAAPLPAERDRAAPLLPLEWFLGAKGMLMLTSML